MRILRTMLILSLLPAAAAAEVEFGGSQSAFPVFGPSAEREAYFSAQEEARQAEIEAQRLERERERERRAEFERLELARDIAEAEAREREADNRNVLVGCVIVGPVDHAPHRQTRKVRTMPPLEPRPGRPGPYPYPPGKPQDARKTVRCVPPAAIVPPYRFVQPYGSELSISVDGGNLGGSLTLRRLGVGLGIGF